VSRTGFGQSPALKGTTTFDGLADAIDRFTAEIGLDRFSLYVFDGRGRVDVRISFARFVTYMDNVAFALVSASSRHREASTGQQGRLQMSGERGP